MSLSIHMMGCIPSYDKPWLFPAMLIHLEKKALRDEASYGDVSCILPLPPNRSWKSSLKSKVNGSSACGNVKLNETLACSKCFVNPCKTVHPLLPWDFICGSSSSSMTEWFPQIDRLLAVFLYDSDWIPYMLSSVSLWNTTRAIIDSGRLL